MTSSPHSSGSARSRDAIITARGLTKQFTVKRAQVDAVTDLDLDVTRGELVAFLGPNGAGKSTSLRMLTTLLPPTSGTAVVAGHDIARDPAAVRRTIGYIGQGTSAGNNQRVRDEMLSQGAFYGMSRSDAARRTDELLESLDLAPLAKRTVMGLSGGQKRRLDIALGLVHSPSLLFLDEPSTGLDPQSRANLWRHILELREQHGTTIFVTTHYLDEADQFAERVLVMDHGRVIADDTAASLKTTLAGDVITLGFEGGAPDARGTTDALTRARQVAARLLDGHAGEVVPARGSAGSATTASGSTAAGPGAPLRLELVVDHGDRVLPVLLRELDASGIAVTSAALRQPTLDDVFLALTGRSLRDEGETTASAASKADPAGGTEATATTTAPAQVSA
ncbi:ATP-binding cassette domain-containing protein [Herbiconiux sp. CPCC 205763]|uniref:ATP-binding cassette domain-containing protein n=1 Tax=Herbiconiux aconitum TaxID=2970913 RepID=A0ABT2GKC4_9MICO|nr:ATP-binding cassette domain-containing protein [Herbiconiux aconitum]MCS5716668.1 ATP-binding cassette domain-containing protein [Herbiconiux aconitum]